MEDRKAYPSDLTDAEWEILEPLIPAISEEAAHVKYTRREIESADPLRAASLEIKLYGKKRKKR